MKCWKRPPIVPNGEQREPFCRHHGKGFPRQARDCIALGEGAGARKRRVPHDWERHECNPWIAGDFD